VFKVPDLSKYKKMFSDESGTKIEYIEVRDGKVSFHRKDLINTEYISLKNYSGKIDSELIIEKESFISPKIGVEVVIELQNDGYSKFPNIVMVFKRDFLSI
jgi:hypothetical protein